MVMAASNTKKSSKPHLRRGKEPQRVQVPPEDGFWEVKYLTKVPRDPLKNCCLMQGLPNPTEMNSLP